MSLMSSMPEKKHLVMIHAVGMTLALAGMAAYFKGQLTKVGGRMSALERTNEELAERLREVENALSAMMGGQVHHGQSFQQAPSPPSLQQPQQYQQAPHQQHLPPSQQYQQAPPQPQGGQQPQGPSRQPQDWHRQPPRQAPPPQQAPPANAQQKPSASARMAEASAAADAEAAGMSGGFEAEDAGPDASLLDTILDTVSSRGTSAPAEVQRAPTPDNVVELPPSPSEGEAGN